MSADYTAALAQVGEAPPMRPFGERDHPNALKLKAAHDAFKAGDIEALFGMMTPDCAWHMPGHNALSGDFVGREAILGSFATLQAHVDAYWAWPLDYFGSDDHVGAGGAGEGVAREQAARLPRVPAVADRWRG